MFNTFFNNKKNTTTTKKKEEPATKPTLTVALNNTKKIGIQHNSKSSSPNKYNENILKNVIAEVQVVKVPKKESSSPRGNTSQTSMNSKEQAQSTVAKSENFSTNKFQQNPKPNISTLNTIKMPQNTFNKILNKNNSSSNSASNSNNSSNKTSPDTKKAQSTNLVANQTQNKKPGSSTLKKSPRHSPSPSSKEQPSSKPVTLANIKEIIKKDDSQPRATTPTPPTHLVSNQVPTQKDKMQINISFLAKAKNNEVEKCLELLNHANKSFRAQINFQDENGWSALHYACQNKNLKFVKILIYNEARIDIEEKNYVNPLMVACAQNSFEIVNTLINSGADFKSVDSKLNTPLHYAAAGNAIQVAEVLLSEETINLNMRNREGKKPYDLARTADMKALFEKMISLKKDAHDKLNKIQIQMVTEEEVLSVETMPSTVETNSSESLNKDQDKIGLQSFVIKAQLGKGSFGEVFLVEKKSTKEIFAMKVLDKMKMNKMNLLRYAMTERNVLSLLNHPFIVKLDAAFQTQDKLFLILEYCPGGDLDYHLRKEKIFSEDRARIYTAEMLLALEELHKRDVIYRDLKPENVVLDPQGHALLTDFGLSKEGVFEINQGAKSFCGSVAYLAPEMLKRIGHGKAVDWYLLGVLLHEMLIGVPPYFAESREEIFFNIEHAPLNLPKNVSEDARSLLKGLLERNPMKRLGSGPTDANEIKMHPFFKSIKWDDLLEKKYEMPKYIKPVKTMPNSNYHLITLRASDEKDKVSGWSFVNPGSVQQQHVIITLIDAKFKAKIQSN